MLGDQKKLSVSSASGGFTTADRLRPPLISSYDFRFNVDRLIQLLNAGTPANLTAGDLALDADNVWTDGAIVDVHVYSGYTYDYYYSRHGRRGLDNADIPVHSVTHAIRREDWVLYTTDTVLDFFANAFYLGDGVTYYGDGLPPNVRLFGQRVNYLATGLDIVAHELTHGVTDYSSQLIYQGESGALNEAFSDMMGTAVEFAFQPDRADYLCGEDVFTPGGLRSMQNPHAVRRPRPLLDPLHRHAATTAASTSTAASPTTPTTWRSKAAATGWAPPSRAWERPTARRSSACSIGPSPRS